MAIIILAIIAVILLVTTIVFAVLWCTGTTPQKWSKTQAKVKLSDVKTGTEVCVYFITAADEGQKTIINFTRRVGSGIVQIIRS